MFTGAIWGQFCDITAVQYCNYDCVEYQSASVGIVNLFARVFVQHQDLDVLIYHT